MATSDNVVNIDQSNRFLQVLKCFFVLLSNNESAVGALVDFSFPPPHRPMSTSSQFHKHFYGRKITPA